MLCHETTVRVRYSETDQMGVVYYGHYAQYFEVGRAEAMRALGFIYRELESQGITMPVSSLQINYHRPAKYDDLLTIKTSIREMPEKTMTFHSEIYNEKKKLLTTGSVSLVFFYEETCKSGLAPALILDILQPLFT